MRAAAFDRFGAGAVVLDGAGVIVDTNETWRLFNHLNDGDLVSTGVGADYLPVCDRAAKAGVLGAAEVADGLRQVLGGDRLRIDFEYPCPSATEDRWFLMQASAAPIADGAGAVVFHVDITSRKLLSDRLVVLASDDELTGLPNRRSALEYLEQQLLVAHEAASSVWVLLFDLDGFKGINDRHGHHVGDELLCKVAVRARRDLRAEDRLCRFGGDEFLLICPDLGRTGAFRLAARLRELMEEPFQVGEIEARCPVSVGFAESRPDSTADSLLEFADREMYVDKRRRSPLSDADRRFRTPFDPNAVPSVRASAGPDLIVHGRKLAVLVAAQRVIASVALDTRQVAERVANWAVAVSGADAVTVEMLEGDELVCHAVIGASGFDVGSRRPVEGSIADACMAGETAAVWSGFGGSSGPAGDWGMVSSVVVPMVATEGDPAVGVLTVASQHAATFGAHDLLALEMLAGIAGGVVAKAELLTVLERTAARYNALVEHLPGTAVLVFDLNLDLLLVAGPAREIWEGKREIATGRNLIDMVTPAELAILEPFFRSSLAEPATLDITWAETCKELQIAAVPIPNIDGDVDQLMVLVTDVTQAKADEAARAAAEDRYRTAFEDGPVGMSRTGLKGCFEAVNDALCRLTGYPAEELIGRDFLSITHPDDLEVGRRALSSMLSGLTTVYRAEKRLLHADGHDVWVALSTRIVRDDNDLGLYFLSHYLDITDRKEFESQLLHLAEHDPVTGLANRVSFKATLNRHVATIARHGQSGALLVIDLDHFKQVNDTLGHRAGDELIVSLAGVLRRHVRPTDVVGRLGGDEFGILLPYASQALAEETASNLLEAIRSESTLVGATERRKVTSSIGVAMIDRSSPSGADTLVDAELAMYDAKDAGRDRYTIHESANPHPSTRARLGWVDQINNALESDRFTLFAQPIMQLSSRSITRHELLLRMIDNNGQIVPPMEFLGVAEKFGLIKRIDRWVVDRAISVLADYTDHPLTFEVNLSGVSMGDPDFLAFIERRLSECPGVKPAQLIFEVTETAAVANLSTAREFADRLSALGCSFALDDFGSGFGGFYYLKYLPFNDLKIDGEFVRQCVENLTDRLVIDAVVTLAQGLNKCTIAEYVEDAETLEYLATRGVDYAQGFHVGRPVPLDEALAAHRAQALGSSQPRLS